VEKDDGIAIPGFGPYAPRAQHCAIPRHNFGIGECRLILLGHDRGPLLILRAQWQAPGVKCAFHGLNSNERAKQQPDYKPCG